MMLWDIGFNGEQPQKLVRMLIMPPYSLSPTQNPPGPNEDPFANITATLMSDAQLRAAQLQVEAHQWDPLGLDEEPERSPEKRFDTRAT